MRHPIANIPLLGLVLLLAGPATAADPITIGQRLTLRSEILDEERVIRVGVPVGYVQGGSDRFPVLYVLGGEGSFHNATGTAKALAHAGLVPAMIVVAIENSSRTRDLTTVWKSPDPPPELSRFLAQAGGADRFLEFLTAELAPWVEGRWRTAPFRILVGHSLGGFFTLHTLFTSPGSFQGYLAISPSLHWDDGLVVREARALLAGEAVSERSRFLFVSLADEKDEIPELFDALAAMLGGESGRALRSEFRKMPEDDHASAPVTGIHRGLRSIFRIWKPPRDIEEKGLVGLDEHHTQLSRRYGYDIPAAEHTLDVLGYRAVALGRTDEGIDILRSTTERFPGSPHARHRLGWALESAGQLGEALDAYEQAVKLSEAAADSDLETYRASVAELGKILDVGGPAEPRPE